MLNQNEQRRVTEHAEAYADWDSTPMQSRPAPPIPAFIVMHLPEFWYQRAISFGQRAVRATEEGRRDEVKLLKHEFGHLERETRWHHGNREACQILRLAYCAGVDAANASS